MKKLTMLLVVFVLSLIMRLDSYAQANRTASADIVCPVTGANSIQLLPLRPGRFSYSINNTSGIVIRFVGLASGTITLTSANSFLLKAGQPYSDSAPGLYTGRLVCQSTTAVAATVSVFETYK